MELTHFNDEGRARMVDVSAKAETSRTAIAFGRVLMNRDTLELVKRGGIGNKGDVLGTAQIGGIMGAKKTSDIIPMCHPVPLSGVDISFTINEADTAVEITAAAKCSGQTGVEMEALTAVSVAALTVYDMCKAVQKNMVIDNIHLLKKTGGKSGDYDSSNYNNQ